jgi:hypothetical protein
MNSSQEFAFGDSLASSSVSRDATGGGERAGGGGSSAAEARAQAATGEHPDSAPGVEAERITTAAAKSVSPMVARSLANAIAARAPSSPRVLPATCTEGLARRPETCAEGGGWPAAELGRRRAWGRH